MKRARISYRLERLRTLILAESLQVGINLGALLLAPDPVWLFVVLLVARGLTQGSGNLMLRSMIYDVADRHHNASGIERAGLFSSIFKVTTNTALAIAVGTALPLIGWLGFDPRAVAEERRARFRDQWAIAIAWRGDPDRAPGLPLTLQRP